MSWLGNSLSTFTGQISNFTKEVLTEGTEEVSDHATELKLSTAKVKELEAQGSNQRLEIDHLKRRLAEVEERAESAELQVNTVSLEYRTQVHEKEVEISAWKQKYDELADNNKKLLATSSSHSTPVTESGGFFQQHFEVPSDGMDFGDVISSQHEINRLSQELHRLQAECDQWKNIVASQQQHFTDKEAVSARPEDGSDLNEISSLRHQVEKLQDELSNEIAGHQKEILALEDVHTQKSAIMKKKHQDKMNAMEDRIQELMNQIENDGTDRGFDNAKVTQLQSQLRDMQRTNENFQEEMKQLKHELDRSKNELSEKARNLHRMSRQIDALQADKKKLLSDCKLLEQGKSELESEYNKVAHREESARQRTLALQEELMTTRQEGSRKLEEKDCELKTLKEAIIDSERKIEDLIHEKAQAETCETLQGIHEAKERLEVDHLERQTQIIREKSDIVDQMVTTGIQKKEHQEAVSALEVDCDVAHAETLDMLAEMGNPDHQRLTGSLVNTIAKENMVLKERLLAQEEKIHVLEQCLERASKEKTLATAGSGEDKESKPFNQPLLTHLTSTPKNTSASSSGTLVPALASDADTDSVFSDHSELSVQNHRLDAHVKTLQGQIEDYEREIETFEMMRSDWQLEKEALEDVLLQLRKKLRQKEDSLNVAQAQKGLVELERSQRKSKRRPPKIQEEQGMLDDDSGKELEMISEEFDMDNLSDNSGNIACDIDNLYHEIQLLTDSNAKLENERDLLAAEKEKLLMEMKELRAHNVQLKEKGDSAAEKVSKERYELDLSVIEEKLEKKEQEIMHLSLERDGLLSSLDELDVQHQEVVEQLLKTRDDLMKNNDALSQQVSILEEQMEDYEKKFFNLRKEQESLRLKCSDAQKENLSLKRSKEVMGDEIEMTAKKLSSDLVEKDDVISQLEGKVSDLMAENVRMQKENDILTGEMNKSMQECEAVVSLKEEVRLCKEDYEKQKNEICRLKDEKDGLNMEVMHLRDAAKESNQVFDDLQMKKNDLEITVSVLEEEVADLRTRCESLEVQNRELMQIRTDMTNREHLQTTGPESLNSTAVDFESQLQSLRLELDGSLLMNEESQSRIRDLETSRETLEGQLQDLSFERDRLKTTLEDSEMKHKKDLANSNEKHHRSVEELTTAVDALRSEKQSLEKELNQSEQKIQDITKRYESYIHEISETRKMDTSALQSEVERLMKVSHEKDNKIFNLEMKCEQLDTDLEETKDMLQSSIDGQEPLKDLINEREKEIVSLKNENVQLSGEVEEKAAKLDDCEQQLQCLRDIEKQLKSSREENQKLRADLHDLISRQDSDKLDAKTLDVITDLESEITHLNGKLDQKDSEISHLHKILSEHQASSCLINENSAEQANKLKESNSKVVKLEDELSQLKREISDKNSEIDSLKNMVKQPVGNQEMNGFIEETFERENSSTQSSGLDRTNLIPNGDIRRNHEEDLETEVNEMRHIIGDKDNVIQELQTNNASLLKLLEDKAMSHGNNALLEIHHLQEQTKGLTMEKEHMMAVLSEKSREASHLKSEVHRLMNVISAEKTAIEKLQLDNNELKKARDDPNEDMTKSAIRTLSQLVRDKDMEMEALKQKNDSLLQVLQQGSGGDGSDLHQLLAEKEVVMQQLEAYQNDREQIINALNQKHQESLAYHAELQRLTAFVGDEKDKYDRLQQEFGNLKVQFEDKQQAFVKLQHELVNYKQRYSSLVESYREVANKNDVDTIDTKYYNEKCSEVTKLNEKIKEYENTVGQKDRHMFELMQKLELAEATIHSKDGEIKNLHIHIEKLTFELSELKIKLDDAEKDCASHQRRTSGHDSEILLLRESNDKLTMLLREKDFEIEALKEKSVTLSTLLQEKVEDGSKMEMEKILKESEAVQQKAQTFQYERDQLVLALKQQQEENLNLQTEFKALLEREQKLTKELERLRGHLLQIEEGYTQEALEAESREKELRNRLATAEEKVASSSTAVESANQQAVAQLETLQQQLRAVVEQRDQAIYQATEYQKQTSQYAMSLSNLQMVLEQFQYDKEAQIAADAERFQEELRSCQYNSESLKKQVTELELKLSEANEGLEAASRLSEQLDKKEEVIAALKEEVQLREAATKKAEEELERLNTSSQEKVDKLIVKNLFLGYFTAPKGKQPDVVRLIGGVLNFSKDEMSKAGVGDSPGWLRGWLRRPQLTGSPSTPTRALSEKSFSEMFVKFLENESTPKHKVALPAEEMAIEQQSKVQHHHNRSGFNPFSAPRHAALPIHTGDSPSKESHLLINPSSPVLPMFPPLVTAESSGIGSASGHSSGNNSGRSTPSSSGNFLRDVLNK